MKLVGEGASSLIEVGHSIDPTQINIPEEWKVRPPEAPEEIFPPASAINMIGQHRNGQNSKQDELTASIRANGLLEPVSVVALGEATLESYISFTNKLWGRDVDIEDMIPFAEGQYLLVISGHSRIVSCREIDEDYRVRCGRFEIKSIDHFMTLQLHENIHSSPPPERAAMAYAEVYLWKFEQDPTYTKARFARENGISTHRLRKCLYYADLPQEIRDATNSDEISFSYATELGAAIRTFRLDAIDRLRQLKERGTTKTSGIDEETLSPEDSKAIVDYIDAEVRNELIRRLSMFNNKDIHNRNTRNAIVRLSSDVKAIQERLSPKADGPENLTMGQQSFFELNAYDKVEKTAAEMVQETGTQEARARRGLNNRLAKALGELGLVIDEKDYTLIAALSDLTIDTDRMLELVGTIIDDDMITDEDVLKAAKISSISGKVKEEVSDQPLLTAVD